MRQEQLLASYEEPTKKKRGLPDCDVEQASRPTENESGAHHGEQKRPTNMVFYICFEERRATRDQQCKQERDRRVMVEITNTGIHHARGKYREERGCNQTDLPSANTTAQCINREHRKHRKYWAHPSSDLRKHRLRVTEQTRDCRDTPIV